jgi:agmatinase
MMVLAINSLETPRYCGVPAFMRLPQATSLNDSDAAVAGLPSYSSSPFRAGTRFAPNVVRTMSVMSRPINPSCRNSMSSRSCG